jgi:hypothetical protein
VSCSFQVAWFVIVGIENALEESRFRDMVIWNQWISVEAVRTRICE